MLTSPAAAAAAQSPPPPPCRFPPLVTSPARPDLDVYELSHGACTAICLTDRCISYGARPDASVRCGNGQPTSPSRTALYPV